MPFCQVHYPFENKDWFDSHFPGDFIVEYVGQTRGWFYTLMVMSTALFDRAPFRRAICHGIVLDENKQKLSKRLKNYPDPIAVFNDYGADALRWYMMSSPLMSGGDLAMPKDGKAIGEAVRGVLLPLWNAYSFFTLYANIDGIKRQAGHHRRGGTRPLHPRQDGRTGERASSRRWIASTSRRRATRCRRSSRRSTTGTSAARASASGETERTPTSRRPTTRSTPCWSR